MKKIFNSKNFVATLKNFGLIGAGAAIAGILEYGINPGTITAITLAIILIALTTIELAILKKESETK